MPRKGKRSRAATRRWQRQDLADPQISPSTVTQQTAQPETPPPAQSFWTKKDATTPSQSPAQKMAKLQIPLPATSSCSHSKAEQVEMTNAVRLNPTVSLHRLRELTCQQCGQLFYTELQLERHQRLHSNDGQPLLCGATSSSSTPHHVGSHKVGPQRKGFIPCSVCGRIFTTASGLRLHSVVHNNKPAVTDRPSSPSGPTLVGPKAESKTLSQTGSKTVSKTVSQTGSQTEFLIVPKTEPKAYWLSEAEQSSSDTSQDHTPDRSSF